jgi:hypothetical protein
MEPSSPWQYWLKQAPAAAQVALDGALEGLARRPEDPGFTWAKTAVEGIPPKLLWPHQLEPGGQLGGTGGSLWGSIWSS